MKLSEYKELIQGEPIIYNLRTMLEDEEWIRTKRNVYRKFFGSEKILVEVNIETKDVLIFVKEFTVVENLGNIKLTLGNIKEISKQIEEIRNNIDKETWL